MSLLVLSGDDADLFELAGLEPEAIPVEAAIIMSALEAGRGRPKAERRSTSRRQSLRLSTTLRLFADEPGTPPWRVYTRDVSRRSLGFVTEHRLYLGYGGTIELPGPLGELTDVHCTLLRCREAAPGWYEGSLYFNRDQPQFAVR